MYFSPLPLMTLCVLYIMIMAPDAYTSRAIFSYLLCRSILSVFSSFAELFFNLFYDGCEHCGRGR
ncbi:hypothetical protein p7b [Rose leaf rosette-associated virus]|uniref:Uncharacterized protein n=1 Tax=Rose leaf rosette-associated virus TaxID=1543207 RepID=A0A088MGH6_9CLOS|nr:hypothetical protein p7b [Rose leaf rosette-associated virus]AIN39544.1 hypothetical protein p7b [Rose leaf rosette-associated virus]